MPKIHRPASQQAQTFASQQPSTQRKKLSTRENVHQRKIDRWFAIVICSFLLVAGVVFFAIFRSTNAFLLSLIFAFLFFYPPTENSISHLLIALVQTILKKYSS